MIVEATNLSKEYRRAAPLAETAAANEKWRHFWTRPQETINALSDANFIVNEGEMMAYIGRNGAGKTTTIKLLTGILTPSEGRVRVLNYDPHRDRAKYCYEIGVVFGQRSILEYNIPVMESLKLYRDIYAVPQADFNKRVAYFSEVLEMEPLLHVPVRKLSHGQRMKCEIMASVLHNPKILYLDEPTLGLDIVAKKQLRDFLVTLNREQGTAIFLTTHDIDEVEALCRRVVILHEGKIRYDGDVKTLKAKAPDVNIGFQSDKPFPVEFVHERDGAGRYHVRVPRGQSAEFTQRLLTAGMQDISVQEPDLEDIIRDIFTEVA